jgi:hypothetical protein
MPEPANRQMPPNKPPQEQEPRRRRDWGSIAEERIQEAMRNGEFTNLRGAGQPLHHRQNIYAGERALAYDLLANNQMLPPEIERIREIDQELARAEGLVETLRHRRDALRIGTRYAAASDRRAYMLLREKTAARYAEALRAINSKILSLNIVAPPPLHRRRSDVEAKLRAFDDEFPRLKE